MFICFTVKGFFADDNVHIFVTFFSFIMGLGTITTTSQLLLFISALYYFLLMIRIRSYLLHKYV